MFRKTKLKTMKPILLVLATFLAMLAYKVECSDQVLEVEVDVDVVEVEQPEQQTTTEEQQTTAQQQKSTLPVHCTNCKCPSVLLPVCGSDGRNYINHCKLECAKPCVPNLFIVKHVLCHENESDEIEYHG